MSKMITEMEKNRWIGEGLTSGDILGLIVEGETHDLGLNVRVAGNPLTWAEVIGCLVPPTPKSSHVRTVWDKALTLGLYLSLLT